jgi:tetratricopeptide (TPR) repeat protein
MADEGGAPVRVQVLGVVRAWRGDRELDLGPAQQRRFLAVLALDPGRAVSHAVLERAVWPDKLPANSSFALQRLAHGLRDVIEPPRRARQPGRVLVTGPRSYELRVAPAQVDVWVFRQHRDAARRARAEDDLTAAAEEFGQALDLWRGEALAGFEGEWAEGVRAGLAEEWRAAAGDRIEARLGLGRHGEVVAELAGLVREHPGDPRFHRLYMLALYRCGRAEEALAAYQHARRLWVDGPLATDPPAELRELQQQILTGDPALDLPPRAVLETGALPVPGVPWELPPDVDAFTGRDGELAELDKVLASAGQPAGPGSAGTGAARAVVISAVSGTAGVGKTALAVHWAHRNQAHFPEGVLYVNLRGYDPGQPVSPEDALAGFLRALGTFGSDLPPGLQERTNRYRTLTRNRQMLVLLDNAASVEQVRPLLPGASSVITVVTSRDSLTGLIVRDGAHRLDLGLLPAAEAAGLLRALIGAPAEGDPAATDALVTLCARLPLALRVAAELAVSRQNEPLAALAAELAAMPGRVELLDAGGDPYSAVASVFSWSYQHLDAAAGRMFRLLSLHPGPDWDQRAAAALTATNLAQAGQLLGVLARAHLIQPARPGRYGMHDLLRSYAAGLAVALDSDQARQEALTSLFDYYLAACSAAMDTLAPAERHHRPTVIPASAAAPAFGDRAAAVAWLDAELPALTVAAAHTAAHGWPGHTVRLAATLYRYLSAGHDPEGLVIHTRALEASQRLGDRAAQAAELSRLAQFCNRQGSHQQAAGYARRSLALARAVGDRAVEARALGTLALTWYVQGRYQAGVTRYQQAIAAYRDLGDQAGEVTSLGNLGLLYCQLGRYKRAEDLQRRALALYRQLEDPYGIVYALSGLAETRFRQGDYQEATSLREQALTRAHDVGDLTLAADALAGLGVICHRQGRYDRAASYHRRALDLFEQAGVRIGQAAAHNGAGETLLAAGQPGAAHDSHARALALAREAGDTWEQARALVRLGDVCRRQGQHTQAASHNAQALIIYQAMGARGGQADALNGTGDTLLATGQAAEACAYHAAALAKARQAGDRYQEARAHRGLARAYRDTGQQARARQHWRHAHQIYATLEVPEADDRDSPEWVAAGLET